MLKGRVNSVSIYEAPTGLSSCTATMEDTKMTQIWFLPSRDSQGGKTPEIVSLVYVVLTGPLLRDCLQFWSPPFSFQCGGTRDFRGGRRPKTGSEKKAIETQLWSSSTWKALEKGIKWKRTGLSGSEWDLSWPRNSLTIRLTEYLNWSLREFPVWPFPGKKCFGWTDSSTSRPFTFLKARGWTNFSQGPLLFWAPRSQSWDFFFHNFLPRGLCWGTTRSASHNNYHKTTWN